MDLIYVEVLNDSNIRKYISLLRKTSSQPIKELKQAIESGKPVIECDYYDTEELKSLVNTIEQLLSMGASIKIYENDREITLEMVKNLIETYKGIAKEREEMDELIFGE
ncbi:hypothetical protein CHH92_05150 [Bacillus sonorensis]|uniref:Uncharacterized protein n=3 Tax=Bacillaceae TaxID=186817 RepID=M5P3Z5_9BACI|nr:MULTISPECIES: hypothetical protein [Bacillus]TWK77235.1 hypothetical protein CHCC20335_2365 [Bacillus paralicheniformis]ASB89485.1 hypothetical protein S101395_02978 [Bacillus sonorensis]EME74159.1 hypothetical protein BSONL12_10236 [Bacillus sonorensis L12]MCY8024588.1 hypothetical protein [Bacillus sonorensis]MCZ0073830.1 hypothetical protein [Bacillus sonorensis]